MNGGLVSTVVDMAKLDVAARLNSGDTVESYGLGFGLTTYKGRKGVGHYGGGGLGFATGISHFPHERLTVVVLANSDQPAGSIAEIVNRIAEIYFPNAGHK